MPPGVQAAFLCRSRKRQVGLSTAVAGRDMQLSAARGSVWMYCSELTTHER